MDLSKSCHFADLCQAVFADKQQAHAELSVGPPSRRLAWRRLPALLSQGIGARFGGRSFPKEKPRQPRTSVCRSLGIHSSRSEVFKKEGHPPKRGAPCFH